MTVPVIAFFCSKGGVGATSLTYHLAWMCSKMGLKALAADLDPQANLTSMFLEERRLETIWNAIQEDNPPAVTVFQCVKPLTEVGDIIRPELQKIACGLSLIPGDLALAGFEDNLSDEWPRALGSENPYRPFRILTAFSTVMQDGAAQMDADIVLADVAPIWGQSIAPR